MYNSFFFFFFCSSSASFPPPPSEVVNARQDEQMECRARSEFPLKTHPRAAEAEAISEDDAKVPEFVFVKADVLDEANRRNKSAPPRFIIFTERFFVSSFVGKCS
jgi:hypothetical protein